MQPTQTLCLTDVQRVLTGLFKGDLHAKRVLSLANATLGVVRAASLAVHAIGQGLALARGLTTKHAIKQVDRMLSNEGIDVDAALRHWMPYVGERLPFYLYLDEFQNFTTLSVATMISELRKYRVGLVLANQHLSQLGDAVRDAVLGNVGTLLSFRVGPQDACVLAKEFAERFTPLDLVGLPNHHLYLRLMIDGAPSLPFSAMTVLPGEVR